MNMNPKHRSNFESPSSFAGEGFGPAVALGSLSSGLQSIPSGSIAYF